MQASWQSLVRLNTDTVETCASDYAGGRQARIFSYCKQLKKLDRTYEPLFSDSGPQVLQDCDHWTKGNTWVKCYDCPAYCLEAVTRLQNMESPMILLSWGARDHGSGRPKQLEFEGQSLRKNRAMQTRVKKFRSLHMVPLNIISWIIIWASWNSMKPGKNNFPWKNNN